MKKIMIVGAGKTQVPLIKAAKMEGYHTVVCDKDPAAPGVALADEFVRVSTKDRDGLYRTAREKKIDGIVANSEYAMCDVAAISSDLGLVGNPEEAIAVLSSKSKFRELQEKAGLFTPKKAEVEEVIVKPDMSSGTRGTTVVYNQAGMKDAVENCGRISRNGKAILEEYITIDPETVIEGEIFINKGEVLWDGLFRSIRSKAAPMIPMTYVFPLDEERVDELKAVLEAAFQVAGVVHGEYNIEACFVGDDPFIIEINPRQGGNDLPKYVQEHCGIDYYRLLVTTSVGDDGYWRSLGEFERANKRITHHMLYPRENGRFKGVWISSDIRNCVSRTHVDVNVGDRVEVAEDGSASIGYVDLVFEDEQEQRVSTRLEDQIRIKIDED